MESSDSGRSVWMRAALSGVALGGLVLIVFLVAPAIAQRVDCAFVSGDCVGTDNRDTMIGSSGHDAIFAKDEQDRILPGDGGDNVYAGPGSDRVEGSDGADEINGGDGADAGCDGGLPAGILGGSGGDILDGGNAGDLLWDRTGSDTFRGGEGDDLIIARGQGDNSGDDVHGGGGTDVCLVDPADHDYADCELNYPYGTVSVCGGSY